MGLTGFRRKIIATDRLDRGIRSIILTPIETQTIGFIIDPLFALTKKPTANAKQPANSGVQYQTIDTYSLFKVSKKITDCLAFIAQNELKVSLQENLNYKALVSQCLDTLDYILREISSREFDTQEFQPEIEQIGQALVDHTEYLYKQQKQLASAEVSHMLKVFQDLLTVLALKDSTLPDVPLDSMLQLLQKFVDTYYEKTVASKLPLGCRRFTPGKGQIVEGMNNTLYATFWARVQSSETRRPILYVLLRNRNGGEIIRRYQGDSRYKLGAFNLLEIQHVLEVAMPLSGNPEDMGKHAESYYVKQLILAQSIEGLLRDNVTYGKERRDLSGDADPSRDLYKVSKALPLQTFLEAIRRYNASEQFENLVVGSKYVDADGKLLVNDNLISMVRKNFVHRQQHAVIQVLEKINNMSEGPVPTETRNIPGAKFFVEKPGFKHIADRRSQQSAEILEIKAPGQVINAKRPRITESRRDPSQNQVEVVVPLDALSLEVLLRPTLLSTTLPEVYDNKPSDELKRNLAPDGSVRESKLIFYFKAIDGVPRILITTVPAARDLEEAKTKMSDMLLQVSQYFNQIAAVH